MSDTAYLQESDFLQHLELADKAPMIAVDTEGTLNHPHATTWGLSLSAYGQAEYYAFNHEIDPQNNLPKEWLHKLKTCIEAHPCVTMHHAKHDIRALKALGIDIEKNSFNCTMMKAHMVNENFPSKKLDWLSRHFGGEPKRSDDSMKSVIKAFGWNYIPVEILRPYGANDALITEDLANKLEPMFQDQFGGKGLWKVEQDFTRLLIKIEDRGILVDQDIAQSELERGEKIMSNLKNELGFNPASTKDLGRVLIEELGLPIVKRTKTGNPSFDKYAMEEYDILLSVTNDTRARKILEYRGWQKTTSSNYRPYLELLGADGRLHANYKQHGTHTGRLSCELPNLQQIPKSSTNDWNGNLKAAFIVEFGRTAWEFDYSQLEFRLAAAYGRVQALIDAFADDGRDVFDEMAGALGLSRHNTKTLVYTIQFGGGATRIKNVFGVSESEAKKIIHNFYKAYAGLRKISTFAKDRAWSKGYVQYWTGRRRHFDNLQADAHKAFPYLIQGGAFEITKRRMIALMKEGLINDECQIDLQVHDSVRADIEEGKEHIYIPEIKRVLENVQAEKDFGVIFRADVHKWNTKEKWELAA